MRQKRTGLQNKSLHKYFELLAIALNNAGWDMKKALKPSVDIPWTKDMVKEHIWKVVQEAMTEKDSTTEINTVDVTEIYEVINRHTADKFGVSVEWPCEETMYRRQHLGE